VLRTGNKAVAALTLLLDLAKGVAAVLIGSIWGGDAMLAAAGAVILGHMFPVWLGFRGGKGVATALGVLLAIAWPVAVIAGLLWLATAILFHYSSLAALVGAAAAAIVAAIVVEPTRAWLIAGVARLGARLVCWGEPDYPAALATVEDAPPVLTVLGNPALLQMPIVAVVGARNASANGRRIASELSAGLGEAGIVVGSGMARGIDAAAHLGALHSGSVAVVAGGADIVYPEENRGLYDALVERGAVVAELPLGTEPQARHFPRRNRIISG